MRTNLRLEKQHVPRGARTLSSKWVFDLKRNELRTVVRYRARLTVRGFEARAGLEHTDSAAQFGRLIRTLPQLWS
jgi:hypothetical protein